MAFSLDLRKRIIVAVEKGELKQSEILRLFQISRTGFNYLMKHYNETGSLEPKPFNGGRRPVFQEDDIVIIKNYLNENPDATLEEILEHTGKDASIMSVHRLLVKIGYRLKKSHYSHVNRKEEM